jgi:hypothetical protein
MVEQTLDDPCQYLIGFRRFAAALYMPDIAVG